VVTIHELEPQPAPDTWTRYHQFRRLRQQESRPEDPLTPDELVEQDWLQDDPYEVERVFYVERDGHVVAAMRIGYLTPEAPMYATNGQLIFGHGYVLKEARRSGLGTALARRALEVMEASDTRILTTDTEEEAGHAFLRWLGAAEKMQGAENRLDLWEVDWPMVERWVDEGRARSPQSELLFFEHRVPDEFLPVLCPAMSDMLNTMPFDDLEHGDIIITPETLKAQLYAWLDTAGGAHHTYASREADGSISGITDVTYIPAKPDRISQMFTGVRPDCRGRGLGKLLKASMLLYLRHAYPEARWIITGNANSNDPMLAINRRLGFKTHRGGSSYQIGRDELSDRLARIGR
jgi:GNAT superfamily N-acetyltransferase